MNRENVLLIEIILIGVPEFSGPPLKSSQAFGVALNSTKGFLHSNQDYTRALRHHLINRPCSVLNSSNLNR